MRLLSVFLLICLTSCPAWAEEEQTESPKRPSPKAKRYYRKRPPSPKPPPTEKPPISEEQPPPSTPSDPEATPEPSLPRFDPAWRSCREDKDCIAIDTRCGWGCINGTAEKSASQYYRNLAPFIECASTALDEKPNAICVKKECVCQK